MIEHAFYQGLNLVQILYLHAVSAVQLLPLRAALALLATAPWLLRGRFPVNSFSKNYTGPYADPYTLISILYRIKKYQVCAIYPSTLISTAIGFRNVRYAH